jgi:hypothetical protein
MQSDISKLKLGLKTKTIITNMYDFIDIFCAGEKCVMLTAELLH